MGIFGKQLTIIARLAPKFLLMKHKKREIPVNKTENISLKIKLCASLLVSYPNIALFVLRGGHRSVWFP